MAEEMKSVPKILGDDIETREEAEEIVKALGRAGYGSGYKVDQRKERFPRVFVVLGECNAFEALGIRCFIQGFRAGRSSP
jgi:hypothetical protein